MISLQSEGEKSEVCPWVRTEPHHRAVMRMAQASGEDPDHAVEHSPPVPPCFHRRSPIATYATGILASFWFIEV
jgi:hypothetical protein